MTVRTQFVFRLLSLSAYTFLHQSPIGKSAPQVRRGGMYTPMVGHKTTRQHNQTPNGSHRGPFLSARLILQKNGVGGSTCTCIGAMTTPAVGWGSTRRGPALLLNCCWPYLTSFPTHCTFCCSAFGNRCWADAHASYSRAMGAVMRDPHRRRTRVAVVGVGVGVGMVVEQMVFCSGAPSGGRRGWRGRTTTSASSPSKDGYCSGMHPHLAHLESSPKRLSYLQACHPHLSRPESAAFVAHNMRPPGAPFFYSVPLPVGQKCVFRFFPGSFRASEGCTTLHHGTPLVTCLFSILSPPTAL